MNKLKIKLFRQAIAKHGMKIKPCDNKESLSECFTINHNKLFFWFNTEDGSTHILTEVIL